MKFKNVKDVESAKFSVCLSHTDLNRNDITLRGIDVFKTLENNVDSCCPNKPIYEITYNHISRKWFVCLSCFELEFFKTDITEKVRIKQ